LGKKSQDNHNWTKKEEEKITALQGKKKQTWIIELGALMKRKRKGFKRFRKDLT